MARNKSEMPRNSSGRGLTAANKTETDYLGKVQEVLVDDSGASSCFTSPANKEKAIPGTRVKLARPRRVKLGASHSLSRYAHVRQILLRKAHEPRVALVMNVAMYETDEFHRDCTLLPGHA